VFENRVHRVELQPVLRHNTIVVKTKTKKKKKKNKETVGRSKKTTLTQLSENIHQRRVLG
jgi:hypothetical protein